MPQKRLSNPQIGHGHVVRARKAKLTRTSVLKMLAVMEASQSTTCPVAQPDAKTPPTPDSEETRPEDFLQSGRTGRRNALANILGEHAVVTSSDLPSQLEGLTTKDKADSTQNDAASTSKS